MPTARELLEQADALMRRNRAAAVPPPVLAPEVHVPIPAPTAERGPSPPPERAPSPPAEPARGDTATTPAAAAPATRPGGVSTPHTVALPEPLPLEQMGLNPRDLNLADRAPAAIEPEDDFPLLTDAVEVDEAMPADAPPSGEMQVDEASAGEMSADEGEPSVWLEHPDDSPSIIGDAPDSIAVVPPVVPHAPAAEQSAYAAAHSSDAATGTAHLVDAMIAAAPAPAAEVAAALAPAAPAIASAAAAMPAAAYATIAIATAAPGAALPETPTPGPSSAAVEARWQAMAEEIRTQVLQRIDLFTDTGLREQLGQRLQPIVDRAGADLVNAINQHVGEILRSYVAEAIEREIERWRADR